MNPEQIERVSKLIEMLDVVLPGSELASTLRALLAEWEERGRDIERLEQSRKNAMEALSEAEAEIERLEAEHRQELRERTGEYIAAMEQMQAEIERSHNAILALTGEIERLRAERDTVLQTCDNLDGQRNRAAERAERAEAEVERLRDQISIRLKGECDCTGGECTHLPTDPWVARALHGEAEIERLKRELDGANIGMQIREKALEQAEARLAKVVEVLRTTHLHLIALASHYPQEKLIVNLRDSLAALAAAQQKEEP